MRMDCAPINSIQWETYREDAQSQLPAFKSLPQDGFTLMQSYQAVLDNHETFTQYFSDKPLESYTLEARLRETLGVHSASSSDTGAPQGRHDPSISWVNIFRHGKFEKQKDGSYHCCDNGKLVQINETLHKSILVNRCFLPANSYLWPSYADIEREAEITLAIEADVIEELNNKIKYVERLKRLQLSLRKRRIKLEAIRDPVKRGGTLQLPRSSISRSEISFATHGTRLRSSSASSGVSSGSDIPFANNGDESNPTSLGGHGYANKCTGGQEHSRSDSRRNQSAYDRTNGVPASAPFSNPLVRISGNDSGRSTPMISAHQTRDNTPISKPIDGEKPANHPTLGTGGLMEPPAKKQKTEAAQLSAKIETMELGKEMAMWKEKLDTPSKTQPPSSSEGRGGKGQKRTRNNFTPYEKEHAPAWFKSQVAARKPPNEIEEAYVEKFGVFHRFLTIKLWVDRMDGKAARAPSQSKVVVLKPGQVSPDTQASSAAPDPSPSVPTPPPYVSPYSTDHPRSSVAPNFERPSHKTTVLQPTTSSHSTTTASQPTAASQPNTASSPTPPTPMKSGLPNFY